MGAAFEELAEGLNHPEGVCWDPAGACVYAGGEGGEIYRVTLDGDVEELGATGGSMLGVAVDARGRVYACDEGNGEIVRLDPATGAFEVFARGPGGAELDTPNMLAFATDGMLYITCSGEDGDPSIVRVQPDGSASVWTRGVPEYPNGICMDAGGGAVLIVESHRPALVRVPILADRSAGSPVVVASLEGTDADGVTMGADGLAYLTLYRPDGISSVDPSSGAVTQLVHDPLAQMFDAPTNLAFVGPNLDRAVVANVGDRFLSIGDLGVTGAPLAYPEIP